jgi:iron complex transport system permease protein
MKVTLDIDQLLSDGRISQEEYDRLKQFSTENTASLALNILLTFGIIAVAGGTIALLQSPLTAIAMGAVLAGVGGGICVANLKKWMLLGNLLLPLGALTAAGGIIDMTDGHITGFATVAGLLIAGGLLARSGLLIALSAFAILSALGGSTGYDHAAYYLCVDRPLLTVIVFTLLAALTYAGSRALPAQFSRLAFIFSCTAVVVANLGFWIGSLWGDSAFNANVSEWFFIVAWAVIILAAGILAALRDLRWLVNAAATFGAIHLYTQWFEHFEASPSSIVVAGLFTIGIAYALISYNRRAKNPKNAAP